MKKVIFSHFEIDWNPTNPNNKTATIIAQVVPQSSASQQEVIDVLVATLENLTDKNGLAVVNETSPNNFFGSI